MRTWPGGQFPVLSLSQGTKADKADIPPSHARAHM